MAGTLSEYFKDHIPEVANLPETLLRENFTDLKMAQSKRIKCSTCRTAQCEMGEYFRITVIENQDETRMLVEHTAKICNPIKIQRQMEKVRRYFDQSRLGKRFAQRKFENFKLDEHNKKAFERCYTYAVTIRERMEEGQGLLLVGSYGTGKTHLAAAIIHEAIGKHLVPSAFVSVPELLTRIRATFGRENGETQEELLELVKTVDLLVLDDIGAEKTSEWVQEQLYMIINSRYEDQKPTVITSNCTIEEMEERIGPRTVSRIIEMCDGVMLDGPDYRKRKLTS